MTQQLFKIEIRPAQLVDAAVLSNLARRVFIETFAPTNTAENIATYVDGAFAPEIQRAEILDSLRHHAIAWDQSKAVGYYALNARITEKCVTGVAPIELQRFYVDFPYHGRGVAPQLMQHCLNNARCLGFSTIWLGVWESNVRAQKFYRKFGFVEVGDHQFIMGDEAQRDIIMSRLL